jgi:hypothetical protein
VSSRNRATRCFGWPNEQSAPLELMSSKVLSVEELISVESEGSRVLDRLSRGFPWSAAGRTSSRRVAWCFARNKGSFLTDPETFERLVGRRPYRSDGGGRDCFWRSQLVAAADGEQQAQPASVEPMTALAASQHGPADTSASERRGRVKVPLEAGQAGVGGPEARPSCRRSRHGAWRVARWSCPRSVRKRLQLRAQAQGEFSES